MGKEFFIAFNAPTSLVATKEMIRTRLKQQLNFESESRSPAHMTVKSSIMLTPRELCRVEDKIEMLVAAKALQAFSAPLGGLGTFELPETDRGIVLLPVEGDLARSTITYLLGELRLARTGFDGGTPHITLANVPLSQLPLAFGEVETLQFPKSVRFSSISIFEKGAGEYFSIPLEPALVM